ncbi:MAG: SufD family Fe-S cluster assembly protein [Verrucomicrobia bacterium]|nr:SufD family Fe-S cluster assembly protein [Verrucomicrobiota bacterium]
MSAPALSSSPVEGFTSTRFAQHLSHRAYLPAWWLEAKKAAWNQFNALPLPSRTDENWRFSDLKGLDLSGFTVPEDHSRQIPNVSSFPEAAEIVFSNRQVVARSHVSADLAAKGVIFAPLDEALRQHGDLVRTYFQKHPANLGSEKFVALNTALTVAGGFLYVPADVEVALPFVIQHTLTGHNVSVFPHTIVVLGPRAKATLVEFFVSGGSSSDAGRSLANAAPTERQFVSGVNDLHAAEGAQLTYVGAQRWSRETLAIQVNSIAAERDARVLSLNLHLGGRQARHESHSRLLGPGADGDSEFDQRPLQTHVSPRTTSNLPYKNALLDTAKTIFSGLIIVEPDAQKTDAYQKNRNLMLSDTAEAHSLPGLEIQANDVKCSHGSTSARIDGEQEFYLKARGINPTEARRLLVSAFFEEVLNKLENEDLHAALTGLIAAQFKK